MANKREQRQFDAAFKMEAVRRMQERLGLKVTLAEISRDQPISSSKVKSPRR